MQRSDSIPVVLSEAKEPPDAAQTPTPPTPSRRSSAIYVGTVRHRRFAPLIRTFTFPLYMLWLDLDEIEKTMATGRLWGTDRRRRALALGSFKRSDYLGDASKDLKQEVLTRIEDSLGFRPSGPVRILTHARQYGYAFNPVSFYYCFDHDQTTGAETLASIVAEITNTPWKERHAYVLDCRAPSGAVSTPPLCEKPRSLRFKFDKVFHVSPFMPMGLAYDWAFSMPCPHEGSRLGIHMTLRETTHGESVQGMGTHGTPDRRVFDATLRLDRREIGPWTLDGMLLRFPLMTARVTLSIHLHALRLWLRHVPVFRHPRRRSADDQTHQSTDRPTGS
ncbi:MAG: DUF1365 domain-containing protein [Phycisphaeraceae bacterium]|nr:DUF1365 domain-containing protein [Phycisphaeraceae bacterium]